MSLVVPFKEATSLYRLELEGGCTLYIPVNQPASVPDNMMKSALKQEFQRYLKKEPAIS